MTCCSAREPFMVTEPHTRRLGIGQRHAPARSIGRRGSPGGAPPPAVISVGIRSPRRRAATAEKHRQERHQQDNHEVQQSGKIYSADLRLTGHEAEVSARSERYGSGWPVGLRDTTGRPRPEARRNPQLD